MGGEVHLIWLQNGTGELYCLLNRSTWSLCKSVRPYETPDYNLEKKLFRVDFSVKTSLNGKGLGLPLSQSGITDWSTVSRSVPHFLCAVGDVLPWVLNSLPLGTCSWCGFCPLHLMRRVDPNMFDSHVQEFVWDLGLECILEVCFSSLLGRNQCSPSLLN